MLLERLVQLETLGPLPSPTRDAVFAFSHVLPDPLLSPSRPFAAGCAGWVDWPDAPLEEPEVEELRRRTRTGRPLGRAAFVRQLEGEVARRLEAGKRGPKPRATEPPGRVLSSR